MTEFEFIWLSFWLSLILLGIGTLTALMLFIYKQFVIFSWKKNLPETTNFIKRLQAGEVISADNVFNNEKRYLQIHEENVI
jgi:hypothetical protein